MPWNGITNKWLAGIVLVATLTLTGCQTTPIIGTTDEVCGLFPPITFSEREDSAETIREIRKYNAGREAYCVG